MKTLSRVALLVGTFLGAPAFAQTAAAPAPDSSAVAAVVNSQVITTGDVSAQARLFALSIGLQPTPEVISHLRGQVTNQLIDQALQQQEIEKDGITVSDSDLAAAIAHIEQNNNMAPGALRAHLQAAGVPFESLLSQMRTQLGWQNVLHKVLGPGLQPTPGDMASEKAALKAEIGSTQYRLAEIFVPVTDPADEHTAYDFTQSIIAQLRAGAPFPIIAAQFSQAPSALQGGNIGARHLDQLDRPVADTVAQMPVGAISNPIRVPGGYEIVELIGKQQISAGPQTVLDIRQAFAPYSSPITGGQLGPSQIATVQALMAKAKAAKSCADIAALNDSYGDVHPSNPGPVNLATVTPPAFQTILSKLSVGQITQPLIAPDGVSVVMLCGTHQQAVSLPSDQEIGDLIINQRVEMESQQLLDQLRNHALIIRN
jgi:peptidyl-prolyl cis-trans isomerase SurA